MKKLLGLLSVIAVSAAVSGCFATAPKEVILSWPLPPEEPRIAYLATYRGTVDFRKKSILDLIFGAPDKSDMERPWGIAVYGEKIYVADTAGGVVLVMDVKERKVTSITTARQERLTFPLGVAAASDGSLFVSDGNLKKVFGFDAAGKFKLAIGKRGEFENPAGLAINSELQRLYVVDSYAHMVKVYTTKGEPLFEFGKGGAGDGEFNFPTFVAIDRRNGNVAVSDTQNFRVQVFDQNGKFLRKFGDIGDEPGSFSRPKGIGIDSEGHIYVADAAFSNMQIFDEEGRLLLFIGEAGVSPGTFDVPAGVYVDEKDRIYVVTSILPNVQVFQYMSDAWKKQNPEAYKKYLP